MNEEQHHDAFYRDEAAILQGSLLNLVRKRAIEFIIRTLRNGKNGHALSIGSGDGYCEIALSPHFKHITGFDISSEAVKLSTQNAEKEGVENVSFVHSDTTYMTFNENTYDCILAMSLLHHLDEDNISTLLKHCYASLRQNGVLITMDPNAARLANAFKFLVKKKVQQYHSPDERELDPLQVYGLLKDSGFSRIELEYVDYFSGPMGWVFPGMSRVLARIVVSIDSLCLSIPLLRRYASTFALVAWK